MNWRDRILPISEWTTLDGRANRLSFFVLSILYSLLTVSFLILPLFVVLSPVRLSGSNWYAAIFIIYYLLATVVVLGLGICITVKRFHDLGLPGIIALAVFINVPLGFISLALLTAHIDVAWFQSAYKAYQEVAEVVNVVIFVYLCLAPGEQGANKYGPVPLVLHDGASGESLDAVNLK
jgi:uncharacterized membrane protein YhaH (DUF805 family)